MANAKGTCALAHSQDPEQTSAATSGVEISKAAGKFSFRRYFDVKPVPHRHRTHYGVYDRKSRLVAGSVATTQKIAKRRAMAALNADMRHPKLAWKALAERGYLVIKVEINPKD